MAHLCEGAQKNTDYGHDQVTPYFIGYKGNQSFQGGAAGKADCYGYHANAGDHEKIQLGGDAFFYFKLVQTFCNAVDLGGVGLGPFVELNRKGNHNDQDGHPGTEYQVDQQQYVGQVGVAQAGSVCYGVKVFDTAGEGCGPGTEGLRNLLQSERTSEYLICHDHTDADAQGGQQEYAQHLGTNLDDLTYVTLQGDGEYHERDNIVQKSGTCGGDRFVFKGPYAEGVAAYYQQEYNNDGGNPFVNLFGVAFYNVENECVDC